jgi:hypothetical protein
MIGLQEAIELAKQENEAFDLWKEYKSLYVFSQSIEDSKFNGPLVILKHNGESRPFSNWSVKYPETLSMAQFIKNGAC